jgi:hypothetical protein
MAVPTPYALISRASGALGEARKLAKQTNPGGPEAALALVQVAHAYVSLAAFADRLDPNGDVDGDGDGETGGEG